MIRSSKSSLCISYLSINSVHKGALYLEQFNKESGKEGKRKDRKEGREGSRKDLVKS